MSTTINNISDAASAALVAAGKTSTSVSERYTALCDPEG